MFPGENVQYLPALHSYTLKRAVDQYNGDLFNMSNWFFLFSNLEVAPMWLWGFRHGANMIMALMQYFSQLSQVFLWYVKHICADVIARKQTWRRYDCYVAPIWQCYVLLGIATWRRYDWHLACENRQYRKIWQIYQVLVLLCLYTLYCIEHCRLINIILLKCLMQSISTEKFDLMRIRCKAKNGFIL